MSWILLALLAALTSAATNLALKRALAHGGVVASTVWYRFVGGLLLGAIVLAMGARPHATPAYWRTVAEVLPPECVGVLCMVRAFREGELSEVQPIFGLLPLFVMAGGAVILREVPTPTAAFGVAVLAAGIYTVGLTAGGSILAPVRALARKSSSWYAVASTACFSITSVLHKIGIAEVGPLPWGTTLGVGSALSLAVLLPLAGRRRAGPVAVDAGRWTRLVLLAGLFFALQQVGLQLALRMQDAAYVVSISSTSVIFVSVLAVLVLGERQAAAHRIAGSVLVSAGAALIALGG
ncbi:EamA family transporter [Gemmatirosa kalamazoonensis]|uniref:EamA family transporter n=1 Tax=Gemmatirosa kalamazoonensis TaxID=861299 RepID=UPI00130EFB5D|nr:EamA family transporter [Gemmatirosa kalamazoonensis]